MVGGKEAALERLERDAPKIVGEGWQAKIDQDLLTHANGFEIYDGSVRDLLRLVRNQVRVKPQLISPSPSLFSR